MQTNNPLTIGALTKYIKYKFDCDKHLKNIYLKGEVSNFKKHSRGHFYFTIKDSDAQISAVMFKTKATSVDFNPKDGDKILVKGYLSVFPQSGSYQVYVDTMRLDGIGDLHIAYEKLKKKLFEKGYFEQSKKKNIPKYPKSIGVCTSPTGAAVKDIINTISRRFPLTKVIIYPTLVQGEHAKDSIVNNIKLANFQNKVDVLIIGRGGGSIEDLWCFNEEKVADAIYNSRIPIISTVGHETDTTISDYVADLRAATPTAGAELAVLDKSDVLRQLSNVNKVLNQYIKNITQSKGQKLENIENSYIFIEPSRLLNKYELILDSKLEILNSETLKYFRSKENQLNIITTQYKNTLKNAFLKQDKEFVLNVNKLELLNPLNIMKKGYSVSLVEGKQLNTVTNIEINKEITTHLKDGVVTSRVINIEEK